MKTQKGAGKSTLLAVPGWRQEHGTPWKFMFDRLKQRRTSRRNKLGETITTVSDRTERTLTVIG